MTIEGEHKIMDFIRRERVRPDYNVNTKHCIMGQDGDWIMLGLATHEPNLVLLREQVVFDAKKQAILEANGISSYIHNPNFEWLHLSILRDYLAYEFETREVVPSSKYDLEATIDDFVFLTFFVGNDFLPHLPALDIADEAFELLFHIYRKQRKDWQRQTKKISHPYLTHAGNIVSGKRLEQFVQQLGQHESPYYDNKKREQPKVNERTRKSDSKHGRESSVPDDEVLELKEEADRQKYREMLTSLEVKDDGTKSLFACTYKNGYCNKLSTEYQGRRRRSGGGNGSENEQLASLFHRGRQQREGIAVWLVFSRRPRFKGTILLRQVWIHSS